MSDLSYDPYTAINDPDPYPLYWRMREQTPLYYNEEYDFYAVTRYDDCERGLIDARPGRTADELAAELTAALLAGADELRSAASVFDAVVYGRRPATSATYDVIVTAAHVVESARPGRQIRVGAR